MRIAIGQLWQETNTFNPVPTTRADFEAFGMLRGGQLVEQMSETNELGGFIQSLRDWPEQPEIVGLVRLPAWPGGRATAETFDWLRDEVLQALESALPIDALLLALHGSLAADAHPDVEGEILAAIRARVGGATPIVATLDLHANLTQAMVSQADCLLTYHTLPHIDTHETGRRGARVLRRLLVENARPITAFVKIPAVVPPEHSSTEAVSGVAVDLKRQLQQLEQQPGVLSAGLTPVQPWLDVPELGSSVVVVTDDDPERARSSCAALAGEFWRRRREYLPELLTADQAVRLAHANRQGLVVLSDPADATTSGAPGDSVWILKELVQHAWQRPVLVTLVAPETVQQAQALPLGALLTAQLGGRRDTRFGTSLTLELTVENLFQARFRMTGHLGRNMPIDMGPAAVLKHENIRIVMTSRSGPHFAPELFQAAGCDPFAAAVVVAKSPCGFRAVYQSRAAAIYSVRAPGCAPSDFWNYEFTSIPRPLWPWDEIDAWTPEPCLYSQPAAAGDALD